MANSRIRNVVYTLNNYTDAEYKQAKELKHCSYTVIGKEIGENKTPHLQGYCEFKTQVRFNQLRAQLPRAHFERRRGTAKQAADYCKKDGDYIEIGDPKRQGKRTDISKLRDDIKAGKSVVELFENNDSMFRYHRGAQLYSHALSSQDKTFKKLMVHVYVGPAGSGKTKTAHWLFPNLYSLDNGSSSTVWFDGYRNQDCLLLDDFYGWIKYSYLLRLLDGYRFNLPIKGSHTWKNWSCVIITSNAMPDQWYSQGMTPALQRRIDKVYQFSQDGSVSEVGV